MSRTDVIDVGEALPLIGAVKAADRLSLEVDWKGGPSGQIVDLASDIMTFKNYTPLRDDRCLFETVHVIDEGNAVAWGDGALDMPATAIERLAAEVMTAQSLDDFMRAERLTSDGLAARLGVSRRLVGYWLGGQAVPRYIALACLGLRTASRPS